MKKRGLRDGDSAVVSIRLNKKSLGEIVVVTIDATQVSSHIYLESEDRAIELCEILMAAYGAMKFYLSKPALKEMIQQRIDELNTLDEEAEGEPPYPDDLLDIPF